MKTYSLIENKIDLSLLLIYLNDLIYCKKINLDKSVYNDKRSEWNIYSQIRFIENFLKFSSLMNNKIIIINNMNNEMLLVDGHNRIYSLLKFLNDEFSIIHNGIEQIYSELKKNEDLRKISISINYIIYNKLNIEKEAIEIFNILNLF